MSWQSTLKNSMYLVILHTGQQTTSKRKSIVGTRQAKNNLIPHKLNRKSEHFFPSVHTASHILAHKN